MVGISTRRYAPGWEGGWGWKRRREEEARRITTLAFQAYGIPLVAGAESKYLGKLMTALYDN